eukprot:TRINITY_DN52198_c0_g1_i1.p1 TRINITY_DN52198_c0_g1~~TRINITY_DN52198_c0_g1_i1.p1  ORF type:complete len:349 (+),score=74.13 TRINITY_DN52198_c0_g1_i1:60-1049(+)
MRRCVLPGGLARGELRAALRRSQTAAGEPFAFRPSFEDHCGTPPSAYEHILPWLDAAAEGRGRGALTLYDPFWLDGGAQRALQGLGFAAVQRNADFHAEVARGTWPAHDCVVAGPPFTEYHCFGVVRWLLNKAPAPFFVLMPVWMWTARPRMRALFSQCAALPFFVVPEQRYRFSTPLELPRPEAREGRVPERRYIGFPCLWLCGGCSGSWTAAAEAAAWVRDGDVMVAPSRGAGGGAFAAADLGALPAALLCLGRRCRHCERRGRPPEPSGDSPPHCCQACCGWLQPRTGSAGAGRHIADSPAAAPAAAPPQSDPSARGTSAAVVVRG